MEENIGNELGMRTRIEHEWVPIETLKINTSYQRSIEPKRKANILASIKRHGFWPQEVIIVNLLYEIVDGQHRFAVAKELGLKKVPISVVTFPDKISEVKFFTMKNSFNTTLKPVDFWNARQFFDHSYATIVYKLNNDEKSLLLNRIAVKGHQARDRFSVNLALLMINMAAMGKPQPWRREVDKRFIELIENIPYEEVREKVNKFCKFFYEAFGETRDHHVLQYRDASIKAIVTFYNFLLKKGEFDSEEKINKVIERMQSYEFTASYIKLSHFQKIVDLITHLNRNRRKNKQLRYTGEEE